MVLERSQFLDHNLESAKMMTVLASLLAESGALKRADTLLRQALELFWRELKDPTPAVARCYRVGSRAEQHCWCGWYAPVGATIIAYCVQCSCMMMVPFVKLHQVMHNSHSSVMSAAAMSCTEMLICCCLQELGALMLKAGKAAEAAKHLQQALDIKVSTCVVWPTRLAALTPKLGLLSDMFHTAVCMLCHLAWRSAYYPSLFTLCGSCVCAAAFAGASVWQHQSRAADSAAASGRAVEAQPEVRRCRACLPARAGHLRSRIWAI